MRVVIKKKVNEIDAANVSTTHFVVARDLSGNWLQLREDYPRDYYQWHPIFSSVTGTDYGFDYEDIVRAINDAIITNQFKVFAFNSLTEVIEWIAEHNKEK